MTTPLKFHLDWSYIRIGVFEQNKFSFFEFRGLILGEESYISEVLY